MAKVEQDYNPTNSGRFPLESAPKLSGNEREELVISDLKGDQTAAVDATPKPQNVPGKAIKKSSAKNEREKLNDYWNTEETVELYGKGRRRTRAAAAGPKSSEQQQHPITAPKAPIIIPLVSPPQDVDSIVANNQLADDGSTSLNSIDVLDESSSPVNVLSTQSSIIDIVGNDDPEPDKSEAAADDISSSLQHTTENLPRRRFDAVRDLSPSLPSFSYPQQATHTDIEQAMFEDTLMEQLSSTANQMPISQPPSNFRISDTFQTDVPYMRASGVPINASLLKRKLSDNDIDHQGNFLTGSEEANMDTLDKESLVRAKKRPAVKKAKKVVDIAPNDNNGEGNIETSAKPKSKAKPKAKPRAKAKIMDKANSQSHPQELNLIDTTKNDATPLNVTPAKSRSKPKAKAQPNFVDGSSTLSLNTDTAIVADSAIVANVLAINAEVATVNPDAAIVANTAIVAETTSIPAFTTTPAITNPKAKSKTKARPKDINFDADTTSKATTVSTTSIAQAKLRDESSSTAALQGDDHPPLDNDGDVIILSATNVAEKPKTKSKAKASSLLHTDGQLPLDTNFATEAATPAKSKAKLGSRAKPQAKGIFIDEIPGDDHVEIETTASSLVTESSKATSRAKFPPASSTDGHIPSDTSATGVDSISKDITFPNLKAKSRAKAQSKVKSAENYQNPLPPDEHGSLNTTDNVDNSIKVSPKANPKSKAKPKTKAKPAKTVDLPSYTGEQYLLTADSHPSVAANGQAGMNISSGDPITTFEAAASTPKAKSRAKAKSAKITDLFPATDEQPLFASDIHPSILADGQVAMDISSGYPTATEFAAFRPKAKSRSRAKSAKTANLPLYAVEQPLLAADGQATMDISFGDPTATEAAAPTPKAKSRAKTEPKGKSKQKAQPSDLDPDYIPLDIGPEASNATETPAPKAKPRARSRAKAEPKAKSNAKAQPLVDATKQNPVDSNPYLDTAITIAATTTTTTAKPRAKSRAKAAEPKTKTTAKAKSSTNKGQPQLSVDDDSTADVIVIDDAETTPVKKPRARANIKKQPLPHLDVDNNNASNSITVKAPTTSETAAEKTMAVGRDRLKRASRGKRKPETEFVADFEDITLENDEFLQQPTKATSRRPAKKSKTKKAVIHDEDFELEDIITTSELSAEEADPQPRAKARHPSTKKNKGKKKALSDDDETFELEEYKDDEPSEPVSRTKLARTARKKKEKQPDYMEEFDEEEEEEDLEAMDEEIDQNNESVTLEHLLENENSFLVDANLKLLIPQLLQALPASDKAELAKLLPSPDVVADGDSSVTIHPEFTSASNNFFWEAASKWQEVLQMGGFDREKKRRREELRAQKVDDSFKDDNYEEYWGERLERDKKAKLKAQTSKGGRGGRGGRGRGRPKAT